MSGTGAVNQERLYQGYAKLAAQLGQAYDVYGFDMDTPLDPDKLQLTLNMAISADANFNSPLKYNKAVWLCYADGDELGQFSFLKGAYGTFYIGDKQPFVPMQVIRCNRHVQLARQQYSEFGPIESNLIPYATELPVFMQFAREDIQKPASAVSGAQLGRAITHWTGFIPGHQGMVKQDDVLIDSDGINYVIDAPDFTNMGYVVHMRLATL